jgi:hypothetical protein
LAVKPADIRIDSITHHYEAYLYRTPMKFGGVAVTRVTLLNVACQVHRAGGTAEHGLGSPPRGFLSKGRLDTLPRLCSNPPRQPTHPFKEPCRWP